MLLVPQHLIKQILTEAHGHFLSGHFGISKTKHRLLQSYYWPYMEKDIRIWAMMQLIITDQIVLLQVDMMIPSVPAPLALIVPTTDTVA